MTCPECGARLPAGGSCRDNFHALLLLESQVPGLNAPVLHFYLVACYGLQHPHSMKYTAAALSGLCGALADVLDGRATVDEIRRRARQGARAAGRVTRRDGDLEVQWRVGNWPMTVADVLTVDPEVKAYGDRILSWARSVREALEEGHIHEAR
jgi:hypothetical protein